MKYLTTKSDNLIKSRSFLFSWPILIVCMWRCKNQHKRIYAFISNQGWMDRSWQLSIQIVFVCTCYKQTKPNKSILTWWSKPTALLLLLCFVLAHTFTRASLFAFTLVYRPTQLICISDLYLSRSKYQTLQELRMLSSVKLYCQVTMKRQISLPFLYQREICWFLYIICWAR